MNKVTVAYDHSPEDLQNVEMAVSLLEPPAESEWQPALRDTVEGRRVIWIRTNDIGSVWVRDRQGIRRVK